MLVLLASRCWLRARSAMESEVPRRGRMRKRTGTGNWKLAWPSVARGG